MGRPFLFDHQEAGKRIERVDRCGPREGQRRRHLASREGVASFICRCCVLGFESFTRPARFPVLVSEACSLPLGCGEPGHSHTPLSEGTPRTLGSPHRGEHL